MRGAPSQGRGGGFARDALIAAVALAVLCLVPVLIEAPAVRDFIIFVIAYGLLATSLNLLIGYTNLVSFGHAMHFAVAAYAFGLMLQSGTFSIPAAFVLALLITAAVAAVIGAICVRLTEIYFAFLTLAFQMLIYSIILAWVDLTGGDQGLMGGVPRPPFLGIDLGQPIQLYLAACVLFVACMLIMRQVVSSSFGYALRMIRDNPQRAAFLGIDVPRTKLVCFVISAVMAGVGGMVLTLFVSGAYPNFAFWTTSGEAIFMIMLGGSNVFLGPLVGAALLTLINDVVTIYTQHYGLVLGLVVLAVVLGLRRGILDFVEEWRQSRAQARLTTAATAGRTAAPGEPAGRARPSPSESRSRGG